LHRLLSASRQESVYYAVDCTLVGRRRAPRLRGISAPCDEVIMRFFKPRSSPARARCDGDRLIEQLESRIFLNAALTSPIHLVSVEEGSASTNIDLNAHFHDPSITGTAVVIHTTQGDIPLNLFDSAAPKTVANFLAYAGSGAYNGTVIQRAVPGVLLQGGGYLANQTHIATSGTIPSEVQIPNTIDTIAMALSSNGQGAPNPNSATSDWFFNLADNTQTEAAFTVFGKVPYEKGIDTVAGISALPKGQIAPTFVPDTNAGDPAGGALPLQNYAGGTPTTSNLVTVMSVQVVQPLAFTVTSDNTALVAPTVSNGTLTLNYASGQFGTANITVTATDLGYGGSDSASHVATTTFSVAISPQLQIGLGTSGARQVRFVDPNGTPATVFLTGPGSAMLTLAGSGLTQSTSRGILTVSGTPQSVTISTTGTSAATTLTLQGQPGAKSIEIAGITTDGDLRAIAGTRVSLSGDLLVAGSIRSLTLASASSGTITIDGASGAVALAIGAATGEAVTSSEPIQSIRATSCEPGAFSSAATITAPSVGSIIVTKDFQANISAGSIGTVSAGSISPGTWTIVGSVAGIVAGSITGLNVSAAGIQRIVSRGAVTNLLALSTGNIALVSAASFSGSEITAGGATPGTNGFPSGFTTAAVIGTVTVGRGGFSNSILAAPKFNRLNLGAIPSSNNGTPFGVVASKIGSLAAAVDGKHLVMSNVTTAQKVTDTLTRFNIVPNDLLIQIV
jgi:cyclophilin family peptidyl-prolyl cis-trans isomerase